MLCRKCITGKLYLFSTENGVDSQNVTVFSSSRMANMCSSTKSVPRSSSVIKFSNTLNSTRVRLSAIMTCNVMLNLVLRQSVDVDKSNGWTSSDILGYQSMDMKVFQIRFGWASG